MKKDTDGIVTITDKEFPAISDMRKRAMLEALKAKLGIVSAAAQSVGIHRDTHYDWMKKDNDYNLAVRIIGEAAIDFAEGKLFELINGVKVQYPQKAGETQPTVYIREPNVAAVIFYLKTKAKHRGYVERFQLQDMGDDDINSTLDV